MTATGTLQPPASKQGPLSQSTSLVKSTNFERTTLEGHTGIIGKSLPIIDLQRDIMKLARADLDVLISGEPGTGKELVARAIHRLNNTTNQKELVVVNCPAIPETLVESELFGYSGGSFTGASPHGREGKLSRANGSTIFFDEIGELNLSVQAKLLRFLQERELTTVGGNDKQHVSARFIAATNKNLTAEVEAHKFRADLYDRLNAFTIYTHPIWKIREDIPRLICYFAEKYKPLAMDLAGISADVFEFIATKEMPGNVRELEHCIKNAVKLEFAEAQANGEEKIPRTLRLKYVEMFNFRTSKLVRQLNGEGNSMMDLSAEPGFTLSETVEKKLMLTVLKRTNGNIRQAAADLGFGRQTMYNKISKYRINSLEYLRGKKANGEEGETV